MKRIGKSNEGAAQWIAVAADIGVLIGLVLVILQLRQNAALDRAHTRHELAMGVVELLNTPAQNPQLASILRRAGDDEPLSPDEQFQFRLRSNALLRLWEDVHYQYRQGLYDQSEFDSHIAAWRDTLAQSVGFRRYWCEVRGLYSAQFAAQMNALMKQPCPAQVTRQPG